MSKNRDLLKEAIADAKSVKEVAIANAKLALEEAFTPHLKSMLSAKLAEEDEDDKEEGMHDGMHDDEDEAFFLWQMPSTQARGEKEKIPMLIFEKMSLKGSLLKHCHYVKVW